MSIKEAGSYVMSVVLHLLYDVCVGGTWLEFVIKYNLCLSDIIIQNL